jgi:hypothetical protein
MGREISPVKLKTINFKTNQFNGLRVVFFEKLNTLCFGSRRSMNHGSLLRDLADMEIFDYR